MVSLCDMELDRVGIIKNIDANSDMKRRFMDIGIVPGVRIIRVLEDYGKSISAYNIMDSLIAIRNKDSRRILVSYE
ncbi:MAG: ferrous iron transport protein A [Bacilli bacterium]|nr:ferrous iron transport protein A [Bacilli bacterium]